MTLYIGIDPGLQGAVAVIDDTGKNIQVFDTPVIQVKSGKSIKNQMDPATASLILQGISAGHQVMVTIEKVNAMPNTKDGSSMGVTSAFNFGMGYGIWQGLCAGLLLPYQLVHPATWKKLLMADMTKDKGASRVKVLQLFPASAHYFQRKKDHGRADALLLAEYGRRIGAPKDVMPTKQAELLKREDSPLWLT